METVDLSKVMRSVARAKIAIVASVFALLILTILHFISPEFDPSWRMISEYAFGNYGWVLSAFFLVWGLGSCFTAASVWPLVTGKAGKAGLIILVISGIGGIMAAFFDVKDSLHGLAALLGVPTLPVAAMLISYHLARNHQVQGKALLFSANLTWIILVLMVIAMVVMITGFQKTGNFNPDSGQVPERVPEGVIALAGYTNRLLVLINISWLIVVSRQVIRIHTSRQ